jgi:site-specific DNA-methyltransferase (adenine-specific)
VNAIDAIEKGSAAGGTSLPIWCEDCVDGAKRRIHDESVDLAICDPPFGIGETSFGEMYSRHEGKVLAGYVEAPDDYGEWTLAWMTQAKRVLKPNGCLCVVIGWSRTYEVLHAARELGLHLRNEVVWRYTFGPCTARKFGSSHYNIPIFTTRPTARHTFNRNCRFPDDARDEDGGSLRYRDMEDVWAIPREYHRGRAKNANKLPDALVRKLIEYLSNPGDVVCDFFMGNFTTARVALATGRRPTGFEMNPDAYAYHMGRLAPDGRPDDGTPRTTG